MINVKKLCGIILFLSFFAGKVDKAVGQGTYNFYGNITHFSVNGGSSVPVSNGTAWISVIEFPTMWGMAPYPPMASASLTVDGEYISINGMDGGGLPVVSSSNSGFYATNEYKEPIRLGVQKIGVNFTNRTFYIENGNVTFYGSLTSM